MISALAKFNNMFGYLSLQEEWKKHLIASFRQRASPVIVSNSAHYTDLEKLGGASTSAAPLWS